MLTNTFPLSGGKKQDHDTGRDRAAFFFWQGADCTIKEKGKSAFLTVRVDSERAPQVCGLTAISAARDKIYRSIDNRSVNRGPLLNQL
jgi:hypothetical protein